MTIKLRAVTYFQKLKADTKTFTGKFHTWGHRGDTEFIEFFGVVEKEDGQCIELDPTQIKFLSPEDQTYSCDFCGAPIERIRCYDCRYSG